MRIYRCHSCDALLQQSMVLRSRHSARCPCCHSKVGKHDALLFSGELALTAAALLLFIPALNSALLTINLLGVELQTSVFSGSKALFVSFPFVAILLVICTIIAPLLYLLAILLANWAVYRKKHKWLLLATSALKKLHNWVMLDVFLISLAIAGYKIIDYTDIEPGYGLICFVLLHIALTILLSRMCIERYWDRLEPNLGDALRDSWQDLTQIITCEHCSFTQTHASHCARCTHRLATRKSGSLQKTWYLMSLAIFFIFPANILPISVLLTNGRRFEDTILSGVAAMVKAGMYSVAIIIFLASIVIPIAKIIGLTYILLCIHFRRDRGFRFRSKLYHWVHFIGKWSMVDICVITIIMTLLDRDNLLGFSPGPGATAFSLVVIFTMLAAESLDPRLIWDSAEQSELAKYHRQINTKITRAP